MLVLGSHDGTPYGPVEFSAGAAMLGEAAHRPMPVPDIDADPADFGVVVPPARAGDAILMDSRTLHAARGFCDRTFDRSPSAMLTLRPASSREPGARLDPAAFPALRVA